MKPTIKDVARLCNVSVTTVSMILNNKPVRTTSETRERVLATAKELGYTPNQLAVALLTKKSRTIGLILPNIGNYFFSELSKNVERELDQRKYSLLFGNTMGTSEKDLNYLELFINKGVDGIIFVHSSRSNSENYAARFEEIVQNAHIPIVQMDRVIFQGNTCSVSVDQEMGGYLATRHLISLGHKRIGCITAEPTLDNVKKRLNGYKAALSEAGIEFDPSIIRSGNFSIRTGAEQILPLLESNITAVFAFNDLIGVGAYQACRKQGVRVPEDISIVGYDDIILSEILDAPLTTIHQPIEIIARETVNLLFSLLDTEEQYVKKIVLQPQLIIRESTARHEEKQE